MVYVNADCGIPVFGDKGAAVHVREMVRALRGIGCDTRLLAARLGPGDPGDLAGIAELVEAPARAASTGDMAGREAKEHSYLAAALAIEARLARHHRERSFDMIYERYSLWSAAGVRTGAKLGVPTVVEVNAPLVEEQATYRNLVLGETARALEREVFSTADALMIVSEGLRAYVVGRGARPDRVHVLGNAVDLTRFNPAVTPAAPGLDPAAFVVGFTGSLKRWHGIDILLEAFRQVRRQAPDAHLLIVGDGPKRGWAEGFAQGAQLDDAITMTGWIDHAALPGLIARMDVATAPYPPSQNSYFSPLKLYEYLAVGRPIVASAIGQTAEVIADGVNGILAPPGDADALAGALLALRADRDRAARLGRAAAVEGARHSWTRNARAVTDLAARLGRAA
ncbi:MAG: glycosyltransferase family 4 protein [Paracoccaceae bacterium]